ncbi:sugar diacid utilization regulator [Bacillus niacini]|uniref:Sugar diacid utilization regulator n=1 Tax=Neobacillus niacini TaxID=86668 RepID=A0A852TPL3_9BACI|nr:V4R domain-containing protein [Neobacillus niacini]NYE09596.1 sugar diacid utilization regulator [Neobacillus niacini]
MEQRVIPLNRHTFHFEKEEEDIDNIASARALSFLRSDLIEKSGIEQATELMFNYGYQLGVSDAQRMREKYFDIQDILRQGPTLHCKKGHIKGSIFEGYIELYDDKSVKTIYCTGTWLHSYEAKAHLDYFGQSDMPVCHTLRGFATGYMSTIFQFEVKVTEKTCVARGDENCTWEINTVNHLPDKSSEHSEHQVSFDLIELANIQSKMIQAIIDGATIEDILEEAEKTFGRTFLIEDIFYNYAHSTNLLEQDRQLIEQDIKKYDQKEREQLGTYFFEKRQQLSFTKKVIQLDNHVRLTNTIVNKNKVVAYLSIISMYPKTFTTNDYLILSKMSNVISVLLMTMNILEKSQAEDESKFTNDILHQRSTDKDKILSKSRYYFIDINQPYTVAILRWGNNINKIQKEIENFIRRYLKKQRILLSLKEQEQIILLFHPFKDHYSIQKVFSNLRGALMEQFTNHPVQIGYSDIGHSILEANSHYKEAAIAVVSSPNTSITAFKDISILSIFINDLNIEHIKQLAKNRFAGIFSLKEHKRNELLKTLYIYLNNNLKIEITMRKLNISKSGLLYRLENLKEYLNTDFKDSNENFQNLLLLKAIEMYSQTGNNQDSDFFSRF